MRDILVSDTRSLWAIVGLSGLLAVLFLGEVLVFWIGVADPPRGYFVGVILTLAFLLAMVYGSYRLGQSDISPQRYPRVFHWCLGGMILFVTVNLALIRAIQPDTLLQLGSWIRWGATVGGGIGLIIGLFEAQTTSREVTAERLRIRQEELQQERDRFEAFANTVSHDLRNPLNVAAGRVELAQEECDSEHLDDASEALERMEQLIDDLLELARQGENVIDPEPVDLESLVDACWTNVQTTRATLECTVERSILADPGRLQQLFENLFRNAVEHGGEGVTVTVGELPDGFYVADDGAGIPKENREAVFEAGYSTSREGTGFGLRIVKGIAEAHGWDVRVTESATGGARFEITGVEFVAD